MQFSNFFPVRSQNAVNDRRMMMHRNYSIYTDYPYALKIAGAAQRRTNFDAPPLQLRT